MNNHLLKWNMEELEGGSEDGVVMPDSKVK